MPGQEEGSREAVPEGTCAPGSCVSHAGTSQPQRRGRKRGSDRGAGGFGAAAAVKDVDVRAGIQAEEEETCSARQLVQRVPRTKPAA